MSILHNSMKSKRKNILEALEIYKHHTNQNYHLKMISAKNALHKNMFDAIIFKFKYVIQIP